MILVIQWSLLKVDLLSLIGVVDVVANFLRRLKKKILVLSFEVGHTSIFQSLQSLTGPLPVFTTYTTILAHLLIYYQNNQYWGFGLSLIHI